MSSAVWTEDQIQKCSVMDRILCKQLHQVLSVCQFLVSAGKDVSLSCIFTPPCFFGQNDFYNLSISIQLSSLHCFCKILISSYLKKDLVYCERCICCYSTYLHIYSFIIEKHRVALLNNGNLSWQFSVCQCFLLYFSALISKCHPRRWSILRRTYLFLWLPRVHCFCIRPHSSGVRSSLLGKPYGGEAVEGLKPQQLISKSAIVCFYCCWLCL